MVRRDRQRPGRGQGRRRLADGGAAHPTPGLYKDWTEAKKGGINLRRWWIDRLGGNETPPLFSWEELAGWRWGPAKDDLAPAIVIDRPDRREILATSTECGWGRLLS